MNYDITIWLKKQAPWLQKAASLLQTKGKLFDEDIISIAQTLKNGDKKVSTNLATFQIAPTTTSSLRFVSLGEVKGIDKLSPRTPLNFGNGNLSVVYGRNGSGKSGYTRILKKACGKHTEPLKSNVYERTTSEQSCKIEFSIDGNTQTQQWNACTNIDKLRPVDIFDGAISNFYLQQENEVTYTPQVMTVFTKLVSICENISGLLESEKNKLTSKLPALMQKFYGTTIAVKYQALTHKTTQVEIDSLTSFTVEDEKRTQSLRERLNIADPAAGAKKQLEIKRQLECIKTSIENRLPVSSSDFLVNLNNLSITAQQKRKTANEGAKVLSSVSKFDGIGKETWKGLWEAARNYSMSLAYQGQAFPQTGKESRCVLCHQILDDEAKKRLNSFDEFVKGVLETEAKSAEQAFDSKLQELPKIAIESDARTRFLAARLDDVLADEIWVFIEKINALVQQLKNKNIPQANAVTVPSVQQVLQKLTELASAAEQKAKQLESDAKAFDRAKEQKELLELEARQWVSQQKDAIASEVDFRKRVQQYDDWIKQTNTRAITTEAGVASQQLITDAYIARFNTELKKLGASGIAVELTQSKNVKGKGKYQIQLKNIQSPANLTNILSDGERRIVSLAAFLADVTGRDANVPFVFDDPISSLDQDFEERTIDRLVELGKTRQVIVFTHRLSFLSILTDKVEDDSLTTICINSEVWGTGEPSDVPINAKKPDKALKKLQGERIQQARKIQNEQGQEAYNIQAQAICSDFRKLMERIVEIVLLADVVQRHRRAINTVGKIQKLAKIKDDDCALIDRMMTKYSCYEHSQSDDAPTQLPSPDDLASDVKEVLDWHKQFSDRA